jgi:hypothetical protein
MQRRMSFSTVIVVIICEPRLGGLLGLLFLSPEADSEAVSQYIL